jgi:hypothetical protein
VGETPESLTPLQWVERYFASRNRSPEEIRKLVSAAEDLIHGD